MHFIIAATFFFAFQKEQITNKNSFSGRFASAMQFLTFNVGAKTFNFFYLLQHRLCHKLFQCTLRAGSPRYRLRLNGCFVFCATCVLIAVKNYVQDLHGHCIHFVLTASSETLFFN